MVIHATPLRDAEGDAALELHTKLIKLVHSYTCAQTASILGRLDASDSVAKYLCAPRFYQTLLFWVDEPRLHDPSLYLPALPPQYEAERLLTLFNNQQVRVLEHLQGIHVSGLNP